MTSVLWGLLAFVAACFLYWFLYPHVLSLLFALRSLKYIWRAQLGRFYVFRDAPLSVLYAWAWEVEAAEDAELENLVYWARIEWNLRVHRKSTHGYR